MSSQSTTSGAEYAQEDFYTTRHPVRRFAIAIAAASALLVLVWWTGAFAPRLTTTPISGEFDQRDHTGTMTLEIVNDAPIPVRIIGVEIPLDAFAVTASTLDGEPLASEPELAGGTASILRLVYAFDRCVERTNAQTQVPVQVQVQTIAGASRTVTTFEAFGVSALPIPSC